MSLPPLPAGAIADWVAERFASGGKSLPVFGNRLYPVAMAPVAKEASRRLPPGSHGIPADVVARNQRERLVAAMAEVCAERGYAEASVAGIAKRAGAMAGEALRLPALEEELAVTLSLQS